MKLSNTFTIIASAYGLLSVVLGAFGAHALEAQLAEFGTRATWETAVDYQMWHALALLLVALSKLSGRAATVAMGCFSIGIVLFSCSLYWLALDGPRWLGPITPTGGLLLMIGWGALITAALKSPEKV